MAEKSKRLQQKQLLKDGLQKQINNKIIPSKGHIHGMSEEERRINHNRMQKLYNEFSQEYGEDP